MPSCMNLAHYAWVDKFETERDSTFSELLCRVRTNSCTSEDLDA